jgi:predicted nucleic acid-binding protein
VIAVDSQILVYGHRSESPWYSPAMKLIGRLANSGDPWAIPWPCVYEFYNVVTNPRLYRPASNPGQALEQLEAWFESPKLELLTESKTTWKSLRAILASSMIIGPRVHDARIANLCIENGIDELLTADRDFSRFPKLKTRNPLIGR